MIDLILSSLGGGGTVATIFYFLIKANTEKIQKNSDSIVKLKTSLGIIRANQSATYQNTTAIMQHLITTDRTIHPDAVRALERALERKECN